MAVTRSTLRAAGGPDISLAAAANAAATVYERQQAR
jgi:hypothetical protein